MPKVVKKFGKKINHRNPTTILTDLSLSRSLSLFLYRLRIHNNKKNGEGEHSKLNDSLDDDHDDTASILQVSETLPPPKRSNLHNIVTILTNATVLHEKDELANFVLTDVRIYIYMVM